MEPELAKSVEEFRRTAEAVGCKISLVGALVFEFSPEFPDSLRFRRTNDADFAVLVRDWAAFTVLKDALLKSGFKNDNKTEHRLHRGTTQIDLIPYGPKVAPAGKLTWPESGMVMTVTGFDEVCKAAGESKPGKPHVPVVTLPGFAILKTVAFFERRPGPEYRDDARDLDYCLEHYASREEDGRRYELGAEQEYETAGAVLLGREVRKLASPEAGKYMDRLFDETKDLYCSFIEALGFGLMDEAVEDRKRRGLALIEAFKKGYGS